MNFSESIAWTGPTFPYSAPRDWQARALPTIVEELESGDPIIVRAIMGSGKAALAAELCYISSPVIGAETIVVSAPSRNLVDQLSETISNRLGAQYVGKYYTDAKQWDRPIVVACIDSLPSLSEKLLEAGRTVPLWIADEAHRTETATVSIFRDSLSPVRRIGLTATPFLGGSGGLESWDRVIFNYTVEEALEDGVIVPYRLVHWTGEAEIALDIVCLKLAEQGKGLGPGVINASTIEDAESFSKLCHEFGIRTETVHSRKKKSENGETIARLKAGELDAVVHVSMLQEGVDLPWLRWILLRRNTASKVRFAQEIGRVLRADKGKNFATVFDPLDLFSEYKLTLEAVLSGGTGKPEDDKDLVDLAAEEFEAQLVEPEEEHERVAVSLGPCEAYLRRVVTMLDACGILQQKVSPAYMRALQPTNKQIRLLAGLRNVLRDPKVVRDLPDNHRRLIDFARVSSPRLNKGMVSDLISILIGLRTARYWPAKLAEVVLD